MGAIQPAWTEEFVRTVFLEAVQQHVGVKIHRSAQEEEQLYAYNGQPGAKVGSEFLLPIGYAFIEFPTAEAAASALETLQNTPIQHTNVVFRLNWALRNKSKLEALKEATEFSIFVGDLSPEVTDHSLHQAFKNFFPSCTSANVVIDPKTGHSRSYGFVRFTDPAEGEVALQRMNGFVIGKRHIRVGAATEKRPTHVHAHGGMGFSGTGGLLDTRTTVFVGKLCNDVTEPELRAHFADCGVIADVYVPPPRAHKGVGFVTFQTHKEAEAAIRSKNNTKLGSSKIRTAWGNNHHPHQHQQISQNIHTHTNSWHETQRSLSPPHPSMPYSNPMQVLQNSMNMPQMPFSPQMRYPMNLNLNMGLGGWYCNQIPAQYGYNLNLVSPLTASTPGPAPASPARLQTHAFTQFQTP